jgi:hypothetical protein
MTSIYSCLRDPKPTLMLWRKMHNVHDSATKSQLNPPWRDFSVRPGF